MLWYSLASREVGMRQEVRSYVAVPMGDPSGIGPEIVIKALHDDELKDRGIIVTGDEKVFRQFCERFLIPFPFDSVVTDIFSVQSEVNSGASRILFSEDLVDPEVFRYGDILANSGKAAYRAIGMSVELAQRGIVHALATTCIQKEALKAAGIKAIGHTEILGEMTGSAHPLTMFETRGLSIFFMTRHLSLRDACDAVTRSSVLSCIREVNSITSKHFLNDELPIAVAALNPHGGEHGLFGTEEMEHIEPAVMDARKEGIHVVGPIGADSVFHQAKIGMYKAVLSLYHDQGHIASKTLDFERTISVTWNLPFIRTSVDHGTAFDIAGKNVASAVSMVEAILIAFRYLEGKEKQV